ncbi:MAG TPA: 50S ribosomal protein L5 [Thermoflexales bacterium]|jgi:large subunit ribosomal protein L5|nr:50S ribosomal protein L5 [Anaerolineae bacterium]HQV28636.1 50S ribosomal protein L5 [Thermoflexales bacterium]HQX11182.1 50S ribosomal protein L5 [Thermoflexales bacterium]HQY24227.1 50S ribosomal protein L5 [Thermoflexales bacterium]HQZ53931.1 50S ribosomal protein L5 [Thermoflexales bacterium]
MADLHKKYADEVRPALVKLFGYSNAMQVPKVEKIVLNSGIGRETNDNPKAVDFAVKDMAQIAGQKPVVVLARKSIANFKLREGRPVGVKVTLRGARMYDFLDRLVNLALPRMRDFRGVSPDTFDGRGNYTLGVKEQLIFPEIEYDKIDKLRGLEVIIVTSAKTDDEGRELLRQFGMPFAKPGKEGR